MTFASTTRVDMQELLADLTGGPVVDAYGTSCFQAVNRNDESGTSPVATALKTGVEMGVVVKPDFAQAAMRTNNRLKPPSMKLQPRTPAMGMVGPRVQ